MTSPARPDVVETIAAVRQRVAEARRAGQSIGLVPTMGALHEGHLSLIRRARERTGCVVVSIFVNPTQFVAGEDLDSYPRSLEADVDACGRIGADLVFAPSVEVMYRPDVVTTARVSGLTEPLCGPHRPGHFEGVTTVVSKLFNIVQPDVAFFGQKDAQQAVVLCKMVEDLDMPIEVEVCPTVREPDGLAMSSRNAYLSAEQRQQAVSLYRALQDARQAIADGQRDATTLIARMRETLESAGPCRIDYVDIVHPTTLDPLDPVTCPVLIALAVRIGRSRLIDNIVVDPATPG